MVSDLITPSVEKRCIVWSLMNDKVKPAEIFHRLHVQYGKETLSQVSMIGTASFWKP
jgi:hypothetical protein